MGFEAVLQIGQFKGKSCWGVLHGQPQFYSWPIKESSLVPDIQPYVQWVEFRGGEIHLRDEPVQPPPTLPGSKKESAKATPPYPPLPQKGQNCRSSRIGEARGALFVALVCVAGIRPPKRGSGRPSTSLRSVRMSPPIIGDRALRRIVFGASKVVRPLMRRKPLGARPKTR